MSVAEIIFVLKPLCDSFFKEPSSDKAETIAKLINKTPSAFVKNVNILYPLAFHLNKNTFNKDESINLIKAINAVLLKIRLDDAKLFFELYKCLRLQISNDNNVLQTIKAHEELKESVIVCLRNLIKSSTTSIIEYFYVRQHAALISHGIYLCISLARLEKSISLRINTLETVMVLLQVHDEADSQDIVLQDQIADVVMLCLPGIVKGLLEIAFGSDTQNHKITLMAIKAWSRVMVLVMQDLPEEETLTKLIVIEDSLRKIIPKEFEKMKNVLENTKRNPEWFAESSEKLIVIFKQLDLLTNHSNFNVRKELSKGVSLILLKCSKNIKLCFLTLLELLITLSEDENDHVANETKKSIKMIQDKCLKDKELKCIVEALEENFYDLMTKMPRIIRTSSEPLQLVWLNRFVGYLKVLGKGRFLKVLLSSAHLRKLLLTLVNIAEFDCSKVSLLEDVTKIDFEDTSLYNNNRSWKQFKFLFDSSVINKFYDTLNCIGEFGDQKILIDSILKMTIDLPKFRNEFVFVLNAILEASTSSKDKMICKQVVEHYVAADFWYVPTKVTDEVNLQTAQCNIVQSCLLLEGLGVIAKVLKEDYKYFLLKTLYLIIEKAGSENSLLRFVGLQTLKVVAKAQNQETIGNLFQENIDYISYHVTVKLRRIERNPGVLDVIEVVTTYSTMNFLPHLKSIVDDLLLQSSSNVQKRNSHSFLKVFYTFVECVKKLTRNNNNIQENDEFFNDLKILNTSEIVLKNFFDYYKAKKDAIAYDNDEDNIEDIKDLMDNIKVEEDLNEENLEEEKQIVIPDSINMIKNIMKRCLHFLPSQDFNESSLAMSTLKEGTIILKDWENELLPIVHEIWHPLVDRFHNSNPLVINHAWKLLCCLAKISKDFIRSRTLKQILPAISNFLKNSSNDSYKKDSVNPYKFTQMFKLQKEILSRFGGLIKNLELFGKDVWNILNITETYLDCMQNPELQKSCVNMYIEISDYDVDMVLIKCTDMWNRYVEHVVLDSYSSFWYSKAKNSNVKSNYRRNLDKILTHVYKKSENM